MNIFILALVIRECVRAHFDKHVVKMILEYAQLTSAAHHVLNPVEAKEWQEKKLIYRKTHVNHPCAQWVRAHVNNYVFVCELALALCEEYSERFSKEGADRKVHKTKATLDFLLKNIPRGISHIPIDRTDDNPRGWSFPIPQAMPDAQKCNEVLTTCCHCEKVHRVLENVTHQATLGMIRGESVKEEQADVTVTEVLWTCSACGTGDQLLLLKNHTAHLIEAYRTLYKSDVKAHLTTWKHNERPVWF